MLARDVTNMRRKTQAIYQNARKESVYIDERSLQ
jgi:hypothetical protein